MTQIELGKFHGFELFVQPLVFQGKIEEDYCQIIAEHKTSRTKRNFKAVCLCKDLADRLEKFKLDLQKEETVY